MIEHKELDGKKVPSKYKCDGCGKEYVVSSDQDSGMLEIQEFIKIKHIGGYTSIFGDMSNINIDICQHCLKKMLNFIGVNR